MLLRLGIVVTWLALIGVHGVRQLAPDLGLSERPATRAVFAAQEGRVLPVLFEKPGRHPGQLSGRSPYLQAVHCEGPTELIGQIAPVRIDASARMSLSGTLLGEAQPA
jgi:hypothetical protein